MENELKKETEKWLERIKVERKKVVLIDKNKKKMLENIDAYISDCEHFIKKNDLIRSFEAVIWAWAWLEILKELKILK